MKVCAEPGCPELQPEPRCLAHRREREQRRGTRQARGYDRKYEADRKRWAPKVAAGIVACWSCGERISPLTGWDLGHCEDDRSVIHGPQHRDENRGWRGKCPHPDHATAA